MKIKRFLSTILLLISATFCSMADEQQGIWYHNKTRPTYVNVGYVGISECPAISLSQLNNVLPNGSSYLTFVNDGNGIGYRYNGNYTYQNKLMIFSGYYHDEVVPAYTKRVMTWNFNMYLDSGYFDQTVCLYVLDDNNGGWRTTQVDATWNATNQSAGQSQRIFACYQNASQRKTIRTAASNTLIPYDNSSGTGDATIRKWLLLTEVVGWNKNNSYSSDNEARFHHNAHSYNDYYYKHISFSANGGSGNMEGMVVENSGTVPACHFSRSGYTFAGWNTAANGSGTAYSPGALIVANANDKGPVTLYAQWTHSGDYSYAPWNHNPSDTYANYGSCGLSNNLSISLNGLNKTTGGGRVVVAYDANEGLGYRYDGATINQNKQIIYSAYYHDETLPPYTKIVMKWDYQLVGYTKDSHQNINLYLFDGNDEIDKCRTTPVDATYDGTNVTSGVDRIATFKQTTYVTQERKDFSKEFVFDNQSGSSTISRSRKWLLLTEVIGWGGAYASSISYAYLHTKSVTYHYHYYKHVTFNSNGGSGSMSQQAVDNSAALKANTFTRQGYVFAGWNTTADGSGTAYAAGATITATASDKGPVTLYAQWKKEHTINLNGSTLVVLDGETQPSLTINDDGNTFACPVDVGVNSLTYNRNIAKDVGMYSFFVPFDIPADKAAELGTFYQFNRYDETERNIYFDDITKIDNADGIVKANTAYFFLPRQNFTSITVTDAVIRATGSVDATTPNNAGLYGTYSQVSVPTGAYGYIEENGVSIFVKASTGNTLMPFRAYLWLGNGVACSSARAYFGQDDATGIEVIIDDSYVSQGQELDINAPIYNVNGQQIDNPQKGRIYIQNGNKVIKK